MHKEGAVKFRGVDIGRVEDIKIDAKDSKLIQVDIRVLRTTPIKADTTATLKLYGITGEVYIELSGGSQHASELKAQKGELPEIQAKPSSVDAILNGVPLLLEKANHVADQLGKIFSNQNVGTVNSIARKLAERYGD